LKHELCDNTGISGATGIDTKSIKKILEAIPGKHSIDPLQTIAILGTSNITWKVLQRETSRLSGGDHRWSRGEVRRSKGMWQKAINK
jgi:hypothetical protein